MGRLLRCLENSALVDVAQAIRTQREPKLAQHAKPTSQVKYYIDRAFLPGHQEAT